MPGTKHSPPSHCYTEIVDHQYDEIQTKFIHKLNLCFWRENDKCKSCIFVSCLVVSVTVALCIIAAWTIYMSAYMGDSSIEIIQTTTTTTTLIEKIKATSEINVTQGYKLQPSDKEDHPDSPYLDLAATDNNIIFFKPPENICFKLSRNGFYHISFSITLYCTPATEKEISIIRKSKLDNKTDTLDMAQLCGTHKPSCFKQKVFAARDGDWIFWKSNAALDKYDGNFVSLTFIEDHDKRKK